MGYIMDKSQLRKEISQKRKMLNTNYVLSASGTIIKTLQALSDIKTANIIMSYMPYGKEVDIKPLNQWILDQGKVLCLPRVISTTEMEARAADTLKHGFYKGTFGILEPPIENQLIDNTEIDIVLVPGLAFDKAGNRMGHGGGYYDRFLSSCSNKTLFVGVVYSFQVFDSIPSDLYDVKIHKIVTEEYTIDLTEI